MCDKTKPQFIKPDTIGSTSRPDDIKGKTEKNKMEIDCYQIHALPFPYGKIPLIELSISTRSSKYEQKIIVFQNINSQENESMRIMTEITSSQTIANILINITSQKKEDREYAKRTIREMKKIGLEIYQFAAKTLEKKSAESTMLTEKEK